MSQAPPSVLEKDSHRGHPFKACNYSQDGKKHLLLAASGSVASIKVPNIIKALSKHQDLSIRLLFTSSATHFLSGQSGEQPSLENLSKFPNVDGIYLDASEWAKPWVRGDPILHIELRRWADILVISPLSANFLAKIVGGFSDSLLGSVVRAWDATGLVDGKNKRILVAPAMNTAMWRQPVTCKHIKVLEDDWGVSGDDKQTIGGVAGWFEVLRPQEKELACGDVGDGAMIAWEKIVDAIEGRLGLKVGQD